MNGGVGCRRGLDLKLLCLWHRPAATAPIGPLAWEPPYATDAALKRQKEKKKEEKRNFMLLHLHQWVNHQWENQYGNIELRRHITLDVLYV